MLHFTESLPRADLVSLDHEGASLAVELGLVDDLVEVLARGRLLRGREQPRIRIEGAQTSVDDRLAVLRRRNLVLVQVGFSGEHLQTGCAGGC